MFRSIQTKGLWWPAIPKRHGGVSLSWWPPCRRCSGSRKVEWSIYDIYVSTYLLLHLPVCLFVCLSIYDGMLYDGTMPTMWGDADEEAEEEEGGNDDGVGDGGSDDDHDNVGGGDRGGGGGGGGDSGFGFPGFWYMQLSSADC